MGKKTNSIESTKVPNKTKNNSKKRESDNEQLLDFGPTAKKAKSELLNLLQIQRELKIHFDLYGKGLCAFNQLQSEIQKQWAKVMPAYDTKQHFIALFSPHVALSISHKLKQYTQTYSNLYAKNEFYEWIINEINEWVSDNRADALSLISNLFTHINSQERLDKLLQLTHIRFFIFNEHLIEFVKFYDNKFNIANLLALLKNHCINNEFDILKTKLFIDREKNFFPAHGHHLNEHSFYNKNTLLDVLLTLNITQALEFWQLGFRSGNTEQFNYNFFSKNVVDNIKIESYKSPSIFRHDSNAVQKVYQHVLADERCHTLFTFSNPDKAILSFINNNHISDDLYRLMLARINPTISPIDLVTLIKKEYSNCMDSRMGLKNQSIATKILSSLPYFIESFNVKTSSYFPEQLNNILSNHILIRNTSLVRCSPINSQVNQTLKSAINYLLSLHEPTILDSLMYSLFVFSAAKPDDLSLEHFLHVLNHFKTISENHHCLRDILLIAILQETMRRFYMESHKDYWNYFLQNKFLDNIINNLTPDLSQQDKHNLFLQFTKCISIIISINSFHQVKLEPLIQFTAALAQNLALDQIASAELYYYLGEQLAQQLLVSEQPIFLSIAQFTMSYSGFGDIINPVFSHALGCLALYPMATEQRLECISSLLNYLDGKQISLPLDFLKRIAEWHYNLQKRATLSNQSQAMLAKINNQCIHLVQGTEQEKSFEDIRTQLLIQFDVDPTKDSQAIHTKENHELADQIYNVWLKDFAATAELEKEHVKKATTWLMDYIKTEQEKRTRALLKGRGEEQIINDFLLTIGIAIPDKQQSRLIVNQITIYNKLLNYLINLANKTQRPISENLSVQDRKIINDSIKLRNLISMIIHYSTVSKAPSPFTIYNGSEATHILLTELLDQIEHPSCDQGPFIRLLIALEPVSEFKFPHLNRRSIQFYVKEYINNYYEQLPPTEKELFIQTIYKGIEASANEDIIDYIPENSLTFLANIFLAEYKDRMATITSREVEELFFLERPQAYHPAIVQALNQHHQTYKKMMQELPQNPYLFFTSSPRANDLIDNSDNTMDITQEQINDFDF